MGKLLKYINIIFLIWWLWSPQVQAEPGQAKGYWVVGSFRNMDMAAAEAQRVSAETGVETQYLQSTVAGVVYYRLLVSHTGEPEELARLASQLDKAGIHDPWSIKVNDDQSLGAPVAIETKAAVAPAPVNITTQVHEGESFWLVIGSFTEYDDAQDLVEAVLGSLGFIPDLRDFVIESRSIIRVMAGPYMTSQELDEGRQQLLAAGYTEVWPLKDDSLSMGVDSMGYPDIIMDPTLTTYPEDRGVSAELQRQRINLVQKTRDSAKQPENTIRPGFNLATLRKRNE
jgi:cell division septation protein DedD